MPDFNVTKAEAAGGVHVLLRGFVYHDVLGSWEHPETGAWLCVESVKDNPRVMIVLWRAMPSWGCKTVVMVDAFEEETEDAAWARALSVAETAYERGPRGQLRERAIEISNNYKNKLRDGQTKAGQASGEARREKAETVKTEVAFVKQKHRFLNDCNLIASYNPKVWKLDAPDQGVPFMIAWQTRKGSMAYVSMHFEDGEGSIVHLMRGWYPGGNEDNGMLHEKLMLADINVSDGDEVCNRLRGLAERMLASDPTKWLAGDFGAPL